jgi:hypothetical protein
VFLNHCVLLHAVYLIGGIYISNGKMLNLVKDCSVVADSLFDRGVGCCDAGFQGVCVNSSALYSFTKNTFAVLIRVGIDVSKISIGSRR